MGLKEIFKNINKGLKRGFYKGTYSNYLEGIQSSLFDFGVNVTQDSAFKLTAVYASMRLRAENIASLPRSVKKISNEKGREDAISHPVYRLLTQQPNSYTNDFDFWFAMSSNLDGWGNAYAVIERKNGVPVALHQVHPSEVTQITLQDRQKYIKINVSDPQRAFLSGVYNGDDVLHFKLFTFDGLLGIDPITYNAISLGKSLSIQKFGAEYYKKGGNIKAVLETDGSLGDDEYKNFTRHFAAASSNFETPLLEYGIKYKSLSINPVAAQLIQSEVLSIQDVSRIFNVPPHLLAELSHATFSNIEHQTIQFSQYSLRPSLKRIEREIETKLFRSDEQGLYEVEFSLAGLMRGDTATRSAYYHNAILDGYMTRNEVRALEGLGRIEGLDQMLVPLNEGIVGKDGSIIDDKNN